MKKLIFDKYSAYYDLLYYDKDYEKEANFINELLIKNGIKKGASILELGCGTGKHAKIFSELGYNLLGVDQSEEMIKNAKIINKGNSSLDFKIGDVRNFSIKKKFDVVISLFHVTSYQTTNDDLNSMFEVASSHLKVGGIFIFDCWYGPAVLTDRPKVRIKRFENEKIKILRIAEPEIYPNENLVDVNFTIQIQSSDGKQYEIKEKHLMRYLFTPELKEFLSKSSFELLTQIEWITGKKCSFDTWISTYINKKI